MKLITKYASNSGLEFYTPEEALKDEYLFAMSSLGFGTESSLKIFDQLEEIKKLVDSHNKTMREIKLHRTM